MAQAIEPAEEIAPVVSEPVSSEAIFEPAEGGYFFKKLSDGSYEQTVYVQNADGSYTPHEG